MLQPVCVTFVACFRFFFGFLLILSHFLFVYLLFFFTFGSSFRLTFDKWPEMNLELHLDDNFCVIGKLFADEFTTSTPMCQFCVHQKREEISHSLFLNRTHLWSTPSFNITIFFYTGSVSWFKFLYWFGYRKKNKKKQKTFSILEKNISTAEV